MQIMISGENIRSLSSRILCWYSAFSCQTESAGFITIPVKLLSFKRTDSLLFDMYPTGPTARRSKEKKLNVCSQIGVFKQSVCKIIFKNKNGLLSDRLIHRTKTPVLCHLPNVSPASLHPHTYIVPDCCTEDCTDQKCFTIVPFVVSNLNNCSSLAWRKALWQFYYILYFSFCKAAAQVRPATLW